MVQIGGALMAIEIVPTRENSATYRQRTALDGRDYILTFTFNQREWRWYLDIEDQNALPILSGYKLCANENILQCVTDLRRPPGVLVAMDMRSTGLTPTEPRDPGYEELGDRVKLVYIEEETVAALDAAG